MRKLKLNWADLMNLWLWHHMSGHDLVTDDQAFIAAVRIREFVERTIETLTSDDGDGVEKTEEK